MKTDGWRSGTIARSGLLAVALVLGGEVGGRPAEPPATVEAAVSEVDPVVNDVLRSYLAALAKHQAKEESARGRMCATWAHQDAPRPRHATGEVYDAAGVPIVGAEVKIEDGRRPLAEGKSDEYGRFEIDLGTATYSDLSVAIMSPGFARWAVGLASAGCVEEPVRLDREIDDRFCGALDRETDRRMRIAMVLEMVGPRRLGALDVMKVFPILGRIRDDLLAMLSSGYVDALKSRDLPVVRWQIEQFLAYSSDPASEPRFDEWIVGKGFHFNGRGLSGETVKEAMGAYAVGHFEKEKSDAPWTSDRVAYSDDGLRALVEFVVRYAHWGYSQHVFLTKRDGRWVVACALDYRHFDYKVVR